MSLLDVPGSEPHEVTPDELRKAITVWLKVMPKHLWRPYEEMLAIDPKRRTEANRVDPRDTVGAYIAEKFIEVGWTASHLQRGNIFSDSNKRRERDGA